MFQLIILLILSLITAYWIDSVRVKEIAKRACAIRCKEHDVQLLDNTVVKLKTQFRLSTESLFEFCRWYAFEFSSDGQKRHCGIISMHGKRVNTIELQPEIFPYHKQ